MARKPSDYGTDLWVDWCPGCGNFGILAALRRALSELDLPPERTVVVSGIGCSGKISHYIRTDGVHTLHGRAIPFATGIKLSDPGLTVVVNGGDGDLLGIGAAHFVALGRRNLDITVIMHDNGVYGLTKGQASPTLAEGLKTKALPRPTVESAVSPVALALVSGFTFVARGYSNMQPHMTDLIRQAVEHRGASFVDVLQICVTYNDIYTPSFYRERIYQLQDEGWDPLVSDPEQERERRMAALEKAGEWGERIPIGIFYRNPGVRTYEERLESYLPGYLEHPPARQVISVNGRFLLDRDSFRRMFADSIIVRKS